MSVVLSSVVLLLLLLLLLLLDRVDPSLLVCFNRLLGEALSAKSSSNTRRDDVEVVHNEYMDSMESPLNKAGGAALAGNVVDGCSFSSTAQSVCVGEG